MAATNSPEMTLTRTFDAPRELVWKMWTDAKHLTRWWGPRAFTLPVCDVDVRAGGVMNMCMRGPDGTDYWMKGSYREVVPQKRIVFANVIDDVSGDILTTIEFTEKDGKTTVSVRQSIPKSEGPARGQKQGWSEQMERLGDYLTADREIVASRVFNAPRELVWTAWTEPKHIAQWWGPRGFTNTIHEMDVRPGGKWSFIMHGPDGTNYPNESVFVEVVKPERIVFDHVAAPAFRATAIFIDEGGKTRVNWRMVFPTAELRDMVATKHGAVEGAQQNLEKLGEFLKKLS